VKILVTGGCGYKGSVLVPKLIHKGHEVKVVDTQWFGRNLNEDVEVVTQDIREPVDCSGMDAVIHLAGIANDPCGELDARLTWEVNVLATMNLAEQAVKAGVKQFIFASSASVYGIQDNKPVTESSPMAPVSDYNKTKQVAERVLWSYRNKMHIKIVRPATVCGVSPRMRFDVVVNMLTAQALQDGKITAHCGAHGADLMRPHVHIEDVTDMYCWILDNFGHCTFNVGFDNQSVRETAALIQSMVKAELDVTQVADKRSYCVDSSRVLMAGFKPTRTVKHAIADIVEAWMDGRIEKSPKTINLSWMRQNGWVRE